MLSLKQLKILLMVVGLILATISGYFSVTGLANLFGNGIEVWLMTISFEVAKVLSVSFISNKIFKTLPKTIKIYIFVSTFVLMIITSVGVYGFLSKQFQTINDKVQINELNLKQYKQKINDYNQIKNRLIQDVNDLKVRTNNYQNLQMSNNDKFGRLINEKNYSKVFRGLTKNNDKINSQLNDINQNIRVKELEIKSLNDSVLIFQNSLIQIEKEINSNQEVSSLRFISNIFQVDFKNIVSILILILVLIFDPLAIALLISANFIKDDSVNDGLNVKNKKVFGKLSENPYIIKKVNNER